MSGGQVRTTRARLFRLFHGAKVNTFTDNTKGAMLGRSSYLAMLFCASLLGSHGQALANCAAPENPIVAENCQPGNPSSEWDISGAGDSSIQGFATDISVNQGETIFFKIDTRRRPITDSTSTDWVTMAGWVRGRWRRSRPSAALPQNQPNCLTNGTTGLIDCGNWAVSASWAVPANATSGIYFAKLVRDDTGGAATSSLSSATTTSTSDLLFQTADTTWQAYNNYGGNSLYTGSPTPAAPTKSATTGRSTPAPSTTA